MSQPGVVEFERHGHLAGSEALMKITTELHCGKFGDLGGFGVLGAWLLRLEVFAFLNLSPRLQTLEKYILNHLNKVTHLKTELKFIEFEKKKKKREV